MVSRIKQLLDWQQLSSTQFADRIGVGRPVMSHILSERNKPSLEVVQRITNAFPEVSLPWLLSGTGHMLATDSASVLPSAAPAPVSVPTEIAAPAQATPAPFSTASIPASTAPTPVATAPAAIAPAPVSTSPELPPARPAVALPALTRFRPSQPKQALAVALEPLAPAQPVNTPTLDPEPAPIQSAASTAPSSTPGASQPAQAAFATTLEPALASTPPEPANSFPAGLFGESGKAIRRIVIFYRDGSFADYQPEA